MRSRSRSEASTGLDAVAVDDAWQVLIDGGAALAGTRGEAPSAERLASAALAILAAGPAAGRERDVLAAFLMAWRQHWPTSFGTAFGAEAARVEAWARAHRGDPARHVKLRRITIEQLASVL